MNHSDLRAAADAVDNFNKVLRGHFLIAAALRELGDLEEAKIKLAAQVAPLQAELDAVKKGVEGALRELAAVQTEGESALRAAGDAVADVQKTAERQASQIVAAAGAEARVLREAAQADADAARAEAAGALRVRDLALEQTAAEGRKLTELTARVAELKKQIGGL